MIIYEVIEELNDGKDLDAMADELRMTIAQLKTKLTNAAVEYDVEKDRWEYKGPNAERSLSRDITTTIRRLKADRGFVKEGIDYKQENVDVGLALYTDYLKIHHQHTLDEKKTFFLTESLYNTIKDLSIDKSLRINPLINLLLKKGLKHYNIDEQA